MGYRPPVGPAPGESEARVREKAGAVPPGRSGRYRPALTCVGRRAGAVARRCADIGVRGREDVTWRF
jgi:hypothetical protein